MPIPSKALWGICSKFNTFQVLTENLSKVCLFPFSSVVTCYSFYFRDVWSIIKEIDTP